MTEKKGGPYTKPEQDTRRDKVYEMYFEKGLSAVKIADENDVSTHFSHINLV